MANVIQFKPAEPDKDYFTGPARCLSCKHEWVAVKELDMQGDLECPECTLMKGAFIGTYTPEDLFMCNCGNTLYHITPTGYACPLCGIELDEHPSHD